MKLYSDIPTRRTLQVLSDIAMLAWVVLWALVARWVHEVTLQLAGPGHQLADAGSGFQDAMASAAGTVGGVPLLGDTVAAPFESAAGVGTDIESAGQSMVSAVENLAAVLGWTTALAPVLVVALVWGALRGRFVSRASAASRLAALDDDLDLFALRALATQPLRRLVAVHPDPAAAWRRGDPTVIRSLAALELSSVGLRPPPDPTRPGSSG